MIRIMIADDHDLYREVLRDFLSRNGFDVVNTMHMSEGFESGIAAEALPDIAIIAYKSGKTDSIGSLRRIRSLYPSIKILVTTLFDDKVPAETLKAIGIEGVIAKSHADTREIITALHAIQEGKQYY